VTSDSFPLAPELCADIDYETRDESSRKKKIRDTVRSKAFSPRLRIVFREPGDVRSFPDELLGITVDTRPVARSVVAGLLEHRSQRHVLYDPGLSDDMWRRTIGIESYAIAWPPREQGARLRDVFEGL